MKTWGLKSSVAGIAGGYFMIDNIVKDMINYGIEPPEIIPDSKYRKFKHGSDRAGWYVFSEINGQCVGAWGSFRGIPKQSYRYNFNGEKSDPVDYEKIKAEIKAAKKKTGIALKAEQAKATNKARLIYNNAKPCQKHPYLENKSVMASDGVKINGDNLVIPIKNISGEIISLQTIKPDGSKKFLYGANSCGAFKIDGKEKIVLCEGYATGASIHMATGYTVIVCFNTGNLKKIAPKIECDFIAADNDLFTTDSGGNPNPGKTAAELTGKPYVLPKFKHLKDKPTDFNDLHQIEGLEEVKKQLSVDEYENLKLKIKQAEESQIDSIVNQINESPLSEIKKELLRKQIKSKTGLSMSVLRPDEKKTGFSDSSAKKILKLNQRYALIKNIGGKCRVMIESEDYYTGEIKTDFQTIYDFEKSLSGETVDGDDLSTAWLNDYRHRRTYETVGFYPCPPGKNPKCPDSVFNFFTGILEPKKGTWPLIREHIETVICSGSLDSEPNEYANYIYDWCAFLFQNIGVKRPETVIVLQGGEGIGKGFFARIFQEIFTENHFYAFEDSQRLTAKHNKILMQRLFVFADEAFFSGDKKSIKQFMGMVTSPFMTVEPKGVDSIKARNWASYMIASNDNHVISAAHDDRRNFVLKVSGKKKNNYRYFKALKHEILNGGSAAFLYDMLNREASFEKIQDIPNSQAKIEQKLLSLPLELAWFADELSNPANSMFIDNQGADIQPISRHAYAKYRDYAGNRHTVSQIALTRIIKNIFGDDSISDRQSFGNGIQERVWQIPNIRKCRKIFKKYIGADVFK